ncbi:unnamed protein product [Urochloa decumbens]|uniref:Uncharacterized protein n=1 Tax=Urochloa decumbens TaxID=240449 RepID=A0ABC9CML8_9POAL
MACRPAFFFPPPSPDPITNTYEHRLLLIHPVPSHPLHGKGHRPRRRLPPVASHMAVLNLGCSCGGGDKENAPPPAAARGIAVKNQTAMKRRPGAGGKATRRRPPLRDITELFLAAPPPALAQAELLLLEAASTRAGGASDCVALKPGRYSLRKGFR